MRLPTPFGFLTAWALLALVAVVGAYAIALFLAIVCVAIPVWVFQTVNNSALSYKDFPAIARMCATMMSGVLVVGGVGTAVLILWSLVPRGNVFRPPGPLLRSEEHPKLFAEVQAIAADFNIHPPQEVYLSGDMSVAVAEPESYFGFGGKRILVIGLPALQVLTVAQVRALIAAGFAHFYAGDTTLNPWIVPGIRCLMQTVPGFWHDWWSEKTIVDAIRSANGLAFVWEEEQRIVGFVCAHDLGFRTSLSEVVVIKYGAEPAECEVLVAAFPLMPEQSKRISFSGTPLMKVVLPKHAFSFKCYFFQYAA